MRGTYAKEGAGLHRGRGCTAAHEKKPDLEKAPRVAVETAMIVAKN